MIRVWMLTWPVTPREANKEKTPIDIIPDAKRERSFVSLKKYFISLENAFRSSRPSTETTTTLITSEEVAKTEAEVPEEDADANASQNTVSRDKVLRMVEDLQSEKNNERNVDEGDNGGRSSEPLASQKYIDVTDNMFPHNGDRGPKVDIVESTVQIESREPSVNVEIVETTSSSKDDQGDRSSRNKGEKENGKKEEASKEVYQDDDDEEERRRREENVETISVFDMAKGFEHIGKNPNVKKVPKEFKKRTTVTLTKDY